MALAVLDDQTTRSQRAFRAVMNALARPGHLQRIASEPGAPLPGAMGEIALALCDYETPVWLDAALSRPDVVQSLRFATGAPIVTDSACAAFAFVADAPACPLLDAFALGDDAYPDRSTTLVVAVEHLVAGEGVALIGPGVKGQTRLRAVPLADSFFVQRAKLQALFPRGVDVIFACGDEIAALPRTTIVEV